MSKRYDSSTGKILIDIDAANEDKKRAQRAINALEDANQRMRLMLNNSNGVFAGRTGDRFRGALNALINLNNEEIKNITNIMKQIDVMVNAYMNADRELPENWRKLW